MPGKSPCRRIHLEDALMYVNGNEAIVKQTSSFTTSEEDIWSRQWSGVAKETIAQPAWREVPPSGALLCAWMHLGCAAKV